MPPSSQTAIMEREAWIDGLRGIAALQVMIYHYITPETWFIYESAWTPSDDQGPHILKLIPIRLLANGEAMVRLFFVLSGYCIATSLQTRSRESSADINFYHKLSSSVFRRTIRLFVPFITIVILSQVAWYLGLYAEESPEIATTCPNARPRSSPWSHIVCTINYLSDAFNVFDLQWNLGLHNSLWSLPLELRGSMAIYTTILGLANTRTPWRIIIVAVLASYHFWNSTKDLTGFYLGFLIAEGRHAASTIKEKSPQQSHSCLAQCMRPLSVPVLALGLYLLSLPVKLWNDSVETLPPDYYFLTFLRPPQWKSAGDYSWAAYFLGSALVLMALQLLPSLRICLSSNPLVSMGRLSYCLFLVHVPIKRILLQRIMKLLCVLFVMEPPRGDESVAPPTTIRVASLLLVGGVSAICGSVLTKRLDFPSRHLAAKLERRTARTI